MKTLFSQTLFFFIIHIQLAFTQQASYFNLGKEEFEGVQIYDVIQDYNLNYWFATDKGFYKYDCHTFKKVNCPEMKGFSAFGFVINKKGSIFCYNMYNQILKIENDTCSVFYEFKEGEQSSNTFLIISSEDDLVVVTRNVMIFNNKGEKFKITEIPSNSYCFPFKTKKGNIISHYTLKDSIMVIDKYTISFKPLFGHTEDINTILRFFRIDNVTYAVSIPDKKLYLFDEDTYHLTLLPDASSLQTKEIFRFYNEDNLLWATGAVSGVRTFGGQNCQNVSEIMYPQYVISDVYQDNENNILLSTFNNGVLVLPNLKIPDVLPVPSQKPVVSVHGDAQYGLLMGTSDGQLIAYNPTNNQYKSISNSGRKPLQYIYSWKNFPYIIFDDGLIKAYHKKTGQITPLMIATLKDAILVDSQTVYLALNIGVQKVSLTKNNTLKYQLYEHLRSRTNVLEIDPLTQNVFMASASGLKILKPDGKVENVLDNEKQIFTHDIFKYGNKIFIATQKNEILFFEQGKIVRRLAPTINNEEVEIYKLIVHQDKIYTNSSKGFIIWSLNGSVITHLNKKHGFLTNKILDFEIANNQIWICHSKGIQKINLDYIKNHIEKPSIKISYLKVNESVIKDFTSTIFDSKQRKFEFTIACPTLHNDENIRYHYQLVGYDNKWLIADYDEYQISYNALASGDYTFLVKAENNGVYSPTLEYSFTILAPFYMRWWFIVGELILFFFVVFLIYKWQLNIQRKKSEQINELNASKLTAIQSQMNPHFIFNSLNSIQDLILKGDTENSYSYITTFANMVRRTLDYSEKDFIDIEQEIKLLELYLSLEKLRFKKDLHYKISFSEEFDIEADEEYPNDMMIPPLLIQPFIENALVHGLLHKEGSKEILINFKLEENLLICVIQDNGIGREKAKIIQQRQRAEHKSFSSNAIHRRFEILSVIFKGNFGYVFEDLYQENEPIGTRVTLRIPIKKKF